MGADAPERFRFHGPYQRSGIVDQLAAAGVDACLLLAEWDETFSYTMSESLLAGIPVIVSDRGAPAERARDGTGFVVDSAAAARSLLERMCADRSVLAPARERIRESPHRTVAENAEHHRRVYQTVGFAQALSAEPRGEWLHELTGLAKVTAAPSAPASPPAEPPWWRRLEPMLERLRPYVPEKLRKAGKSLVLGGGAGRRVLVLDPGRKVTTAGLRPLRRRGSATRFEVENADPQLVYSIGPLPGERIKELRFKLRREGTASATAQLFWAAGPEDGFSEDCSAVIALDAPPGEWREYRLRLDGDEAFARSRGGPIARLRFDPIDQPGIIELGRLELYG